MGVLKRKSFSGFVAVALFTSAVVAISAAPAHGQTSDEWDQLGPDIDGAVADDQSGTSVAISANGARIAIGAPFWDDVSENNPSAGHVRVFERVGSGWTQVGFQIVGEQAFGRYGTSVAISADGNRVAVGAPRHSLSTGTVRVFDWSGSAWVQVGVDIDGEFPLDSSGQSVAMSASGNRVAVGAPGNDDNGSNAGHVRIWEQVGSNWIQVGDDIDGDNGDFSGESVAMSADGSRVAIGAPGSDDNGLDAGKVRIWEQVGSNWVQVGPDVDGEAAGDQSGESVTMSDGGARVAVGAPFNDGNGTNSGHVRIWEQVGSNWIQVGADIDGEGSGNFSGQSVSMSSNGDRVAIGANGSNIFRGQVRIWEQAGSNWIQVGADINGEQLLDEFGRSVAISSNGDRVAIGAPLNDGNGADSGHVRVFEQTLLCNGLAVNVDLGAGDTPTAGDDVILGTNGNDLIVAGAGNDTICGGGGDDTINGGPGDDWIEAGDGDDTVFGLTGHDIIFGGAGVDELLGQGDDDTIEGGPDNDTINGGGGNDTLSGNDGIDTVFGLDGNDTLNGGTGNDTLFGQGNDDTIFGDGGDDRINAGTGNDTADGGDGIDNVFGLSGNDTLDGGPGNDFVHGFGGDDILDGGAGDDLVLGTAGNDTINETSGTNTINGGPGDDILNGGTGNDTIFGDGDLNQAGNDTITGGDGIDLIISFSGDDTITTAGDGLVDTVNAGPHNNGDSCTADTGPITDLVFNCNP